MIVGRRSTDYSRRPDAGAFGMDAAGLSDALFHADARRLTERERSRLAALLANLVRSAEQAMRLRLLPTIDEARYPALAAALIAPDLPIALPMIEAGALLDHPDILSVLWRRVAEARLREVGRRTGSVAAGSVEQLVIAPQARVAACALAFLAAEVRGVRRFDEDAPQDGELPAEGQHRLVWVVAATFSHYLSRHHGVPGPRADALVGAVAAAMLVGYDEADSLDSHGVRLARALGDARRISPQLLGEVAREGRLSLLAPMLAQLASVDPAMAWTVLLGDDVDAVLALLRLGEVAPSDASQLVLRLRALTDEGGRWAVAWLEERVTRYATQPRSDARDRLRRAMLDPVARTALARLEAGAPAS